MHWEVVRKQMCLCKGVKAICDIGMLLMWTLDSLLLGTYPHIVERLGDNLLLSLHVASIILLWQKISNYHINWYSSLDNKVMFPVLKYVGIYMDFFKLKKWILNFVLALNHRPFLPFYLYDGWISEQNNV